MFTRRSVIPILVLVLGLVSCSTRAERPTPRVETSPATSLLSPTQPLQTHPGSTTTLTAETAFARPVVSLDQVTNVPPSIPVSLDENKNQVGLAEKSPDLRDEVRNRVWALTQAANQNFGLTAGEMDTFRLTREDFTQGRVFFNQDAASGQWILYFKLGNGNIMHRVISYGGGGMQWFDYPATYDATTTGITGDYLPLAIPGGEEGVVWFHSPDGKVVIPQFVASPKTLADGSRVFTQALHYSLAYEVETWVEIPGTESFAYATPTPEYAIPGTEIVSHYTETIRAEDTKYNIPVMIITDEKMIHANPMMTIDKIYINDDPNFKTRYGETAKEAIAHAVAYAEYQCWQKNDPDKVGQRAGIGFNTYWQMVKEAQAGKRDWSEVEFQTWANDLTTPEYDASKRTFRPGSNVAIVFVNSYKNTMVDLFDGAYDFGTEVDKRGDLAIYIGGYPTAGALGGAIVNATTTVNFSMALDRLSWKTQGNKFPENEFWENLAGRYNHEIFHLFSRESKPPKGWKDRFADWGQWAPGWYETALEIIPNDEAKLFSQP